jgi:hypothetical protein
MEDEIGGLTSGTVSRRQSYLSGVNDGRYSSVGTILLWNGHTSGFSYPSTQCPAVKTHSSLIKVPPHKYLGMVLDLPMIATCQGS